MTFRVDSGNAEARDFRSTRVTPQRDREAVLWGNSAGERHSYAVLLSKGVRSLLTPGDAVPNAVGAVRPATGSLDEIVLRELPEPRPDRPLRSWLFNTLLVVEI